MKDLKTMNLDSKIAIFSIDEIKELEKENFFHKIFTKNVHKNLDKSNAVETLYDNYEIVDVHYLDGNLSDTPVIVIIVDKQKLENSPLKYLEELLPQLDLSNLRDNYNYSSIIPRDRHTSTTGSSITL